MRKHSYLRNDAVARLATANSKLLKKIRNMFQKYPSNATLLLASNCLSFRPCMRNTKRIGLNCNDYDTVQYTLPSSSHCLHSRTLNLDPRKQKRHAATLRAVPRGVRQDQSKNECEKNQYAPIILAMIFFYKSRGVGPTYLVGIARRRQGDEQREGQRGEQLAEGLRGRFLSVSRRRARP
jgi:hypothetical protein